MAAKGKLRILCLHGYRQNDVLFREKTGSLRKLFKSTAEFEFLSAPLQPNVPSDDTREDPRAWWFSKPSSEFSSRDVTTIADGFSDSVGAVLDFLREKGPFDGLLGFSQGASMVHLLLAMERQGQVQLGVRFAIFFSGFLSLSSIHEPYLSVEFPDLPSLHIFGSGDEIVLQTTSERLSEKFTDKEVIVHDGGHFIPSLSKHKQAVLSFLTRHCCESD